MAIDQRVNRLRKSIIKEHNECYLHSTFLNEMRTLNNYT